MMWRDVGAACVRAGIEHLSCNDLRRAFAGWHREALMAVGASASSAAELVSKLLRHATDRLAQTTYADVDAQVVGRAISKLFLPPQRGCLVGPGMQVDASSLRHWDPPHADDNIEDLRRTGIIENIRAAFRFRGIEIEVVG